jgi:hypothetical protein
MHLFAYMHMCDYLDLAQHRVEAVVDGDIVDASVAHQRQQVQNKISGATKPIESLHNIHIETRA